MFPCFDFSELFVAPTVFALDKVDSDSGWCATVAVAVAVDFEVIRFTYSSVSS